MTNARKIRAETAIKRMVSEAFLGWIKERFSEAWLQPINNKMGTTISRKTRKARRGGCGFSFGAMSFYANLPALRYLSPAPGPASAWLPGMKCVLPGREIRFQRTSTALGLLPLAVPLSSFNQERMKFIKKPFVRRQVLMEKRWAD